MSLFRRSEPAASTEPRPDGADADEAMVVGERGITSVNRSRSMQSRVSSVLALGLMLTLGLGFLTWYYAKTMSRPARAQQSAQVATKTKAQGEMPLPPLGRVDPPAWARAASTEAATGESDAAQSAVEAVLGPPPEPPQPPPSAWNTGGTYSPTYGAGPTGYGAAHKTPGQLAFERRLSGPVFVGRSEETVPASGSPGTPPYMERPGYGDPLAVGAPWADSSANEPASPTNAGDEGLSALLQPSATPAVQARVLPTERMLLAKGAFIDCTLETAIDSSLAGLTTCITATDTFSVDGKVVLLERGTKLVGETQGQVRQGSARAFVLWTEARTPAGVIVPLASPGTDELGRAGLPGKVNRHFWERFGAAILISVIDGAVQAAAQSEGGGGTVIYNPSSTENIMTEVLKSTLSIPPTVVKAHGDRIQVLVARDLDFRSVYELRRGVAGDD